MTNNERSTVEQVLGRFKWMLEKVEKLESGNFAHAKGSLKGEVRWCETALLKLLDEKG